MEKIQIKLKECCLTCEHYYPDGIGMGSYCSISGKREISCLHMPVCQTYNGHKPIEVVSCGQCKRWCPDGTYGTGPNGKMELERIYSEHGKLDAADVVDESRPETAVLHSCFEWRDDVAAEKYREEQARALVRCVVTVQEAEGQKPVEVRAFFHIQETYHPTSVIIQEEDKYITLLQTALLSL